MLHNRQEVQLPFCGCFPSWGTTTTTTETPALVAAAAVVAVAEQGVAEEGAVAHLRGVDDDDETIGAALPQ